MSEQKAWCITGADGGPGVDVARAEPSHIHVPRPSRVRVAQTSGRWPYAAAEPSHIHIPRRSRVRRADEGAAPFELPELCAQRSLI
ncbi:MAG TPA: hypothetical protein VHN78_11660 [Chloroflexota bacterium]|nr:hypothetical protein [Chloroflexota bacterium]